jgi:regulatory protein spx
MIKLFTIKGCIRCKKIEEFLIEHKLEYSKKDLMMTTFTDEEVKDILSLAPEGFNDIISSRSLIFKKENIKFEDMPMNDAIEFIKSHPDACHRPIILQYFENRPIRLLVGFNKAENQILLRTDDEKYFKSIPCEETCICSNILRSFEHE